jgi:hypothetical protein
LARSAMPCADLGRRSMSRNFSNSSWLKLILLTGRPFEPQPIDLRKDVPHPMRALAPVLYLRQGMFVIVLLRQEKAVEIGGGDDKFCLEEKEVESKAPTKHARISLIPPLVPGCWHARKRWLPTREATPLKSLAHPTI